MKKILKLVLGLLLIGSMAFGATTETAQVLVSTSIGETTANSGIKVVQNYTGNTNSEFDTVFFAAGGLLSLASGVDTSITAAEGTFFVLVRRPVSGTISVAIKSTAMTLTGGTATIPYKIMGTETASPPTYIDYTVATPKVEETYTTSAAESGVLRDYKQFKYIIPISTTAPLGAYSATITFSITTP